MSTSIEVGIGVRAPAVIIEDDHRHYKFKHHKRK